MREGNSLGKSTTLQGQAASGTALPEGVEQAFDYRGDVTIKLKTGNTIEGYVYDRQGSPNSGKARLRIMLKNEARKLTVEQSEIEELNFSGRDMADGRSFEAWVKKYAEKKAAGESNIELVPEQLD